MAFSSAEARRADEGDMQRARADPYTNWLLGLTLIVFLLAAAHGAVRRHGPRSRTRMRCRRRRLALETAMAVAAAAVAVLAGTRFAVEGRRVDLLLCAGFAVAALGGLAFDVVPSLGRDGPRSRRSVVGTARTRAFGVARRRGRLRDRASRGAPPRDGRDGRRRGHGPRHRLDRACRSGASSLPLVPPGGRPRDRSSSP